MIARFGFIFLLLGFGLLMFAAGLLAPASLRQPVQGWSAQLLALAGQEAARVPAASAAIAPARSAAAPAAAAPAAAPPVPAESLLLPTPLPAKGSYGVQAGQFATLDAAQALLRQMRSLYLPCMPPIAVVDRTGLQSFVAAVGPYASLAEAREARRQVAQSLQQLTPPLILLPAAPPGAT
ncbi:SPOR domain-containing protein [Janthinobacterium sp. PC23-8]|uniref:SPOR domain-containing protein n=1 Tax=Janthinobacterium sp. PC23-8 TaxID=2012679 RepID=UPI0011407E15|nr:SPOR domain-containing protein [Janthinobacterium sp. PC23-8]